MNKTPKMQPPIIIQSTNDLPPTGGVFVLASASEWQDFVDRNAKPAKLKPSK